MKAQRGSRGISLLTYLLTPWSRVLFEKLTGSAASQEIPRIFGTRKFLTVFKSARHLSLSWANSLQSPQPPPTSWRSILILSSHLRLGLPNGLRYIFTLSLTLALDGGWVVKATPGRFTPGKETRYPLCKRLDEPQGHSGRVRKVSPTPGFDPRTFQRLASRCTDWAIPSTLR